MVSISRSAVLSALAAPAVVKALKVEQHVQYGPAIYKKVRSIIYTGQQDSVNNGRDLQETESATLRCFYQCLEQGMTSEQCVQYIQDTIGEDLSLHEIPELKIKVSPPRTPEAIDSSYWMFGIPTNIYGQVDCDINDGIIEYPWAWQTGPETTISIPPVDCIGMDAHDCCDKFLTTMTNEDIPLVDINGNCLSCWVHQEPLEPIISAATGSIAYIEHSFDAATSSCAATELDAPTVQATDSSVETALVPVRAAIDDILGQSPVNCGDFMNLHRDLLFYGRAFPQAMSQISGLLCGICATPEDEYELTEEMKFRLEFIKLKLTGEIKSDENCIIIYTDHQDLVLEPPKIGGSRHELDFDRMDPDCESPNTTGDNPGGNTNPDGPSCAEGEALDPVTGLCVPAGDVPDETPGPDTPDETPGPDTPDETPGPDTPDETPGPDTPDETPGPDEGDDDVCPTENMITADMVTADGDCKMECTIDEIIAGEIEACGTDLPTCFARECSSEWSPECLALISDESTDAVAWNECIVQGFITPVGMGGPDGTSPGDSKSSMKSTKTKSKTKSTKTKATKTKTKSKSRRRAQRNLRNLASGSSKSKSTKAKSMKTKSTKSKSSAKSKTSSGTGPAPSDGSYGDVPAPIGAGPSTVTMCVSACEAMEVGFYFVDKVSSSAFAPGPPALPEGNTPQGTTTGGSMKSKRGSAKTKAGSTKTKTKAGSAKTKAGSRKTKAGSTTSRSRSRSRSRRRQL